MNFQNNKLYYEPAPYYEMDHLDDAVTFTNDSRFYSQFDGKDSTKNIQTTSTETVEEHLSNQLQVQLNLNESPQSPETSSSSKPPVNMADLRAQVSALVSQLDRLLSKVQKHQNKTS